MSLPRRQHLLLMIFVAALAARLGFVAARGTLATIDTSEYQLLARNMLHLHAFSTSENEPLRPAICRPPVYPLFLASVMTVSPSTIASAIAQAVLDSLVCVMIFLMASRVVRVPVAAAVSFLYALHPGPISASATLLSESLFAALLVTGVFLAFIAAERVSITLALCSGAVFGLATLCRSIGVIYVIAVVCVLLARRFRRTALALVLGAVVIVAPWVIRTSRVAGRFVFIQAPSALAWYLPSLWWLDQNDEPAVWRYFVSSDPYGARLSAARAPAAVMDADDFARHQAIANIRKNPERYLLSRVRAFPHLVFNTFDRATGINRSIGEVFRAHDDGLLTIKLVLMLVFTALPMMASLFGIGASWRTLTASLAAAMWIVTLVVHIPMWIEYRYWLPVVPFHFVTAAIGIQRLRDRANVTRRTTSSE